MTTLRLMSDGRINNNFKTELVINRKLYVDEHG